MPPRVLPLLLVLLCVVGFVGCSGEVGPAGPQGPAGQDGNPSVIAYGDVDCFIGAVSLLSSGPAGVTVTPTWIADTNINVTITGSFPATTGVLLVSISSSDGTNADTFIAGTITSWSTTQIGLNVQTLDPNGPGNVEDFSFVVLGY